MTTHDRVAIAGLSVQGTKSPTNEDSWGLEHHGDSTLIVVADGMGGEAKGQEASRTLVEVLREKTAEILSALSLDKSLDLVREAFQDTHNRLQDRMRADTFAVGMATTAVVVVIRPDGVGHRYVGDSRLYHVRGELALYQTRDHSIIQGLLDLGHVRPEQVKTHPMRNQLTSAIGGKRDWSTIEDGPEVVGNRLIALEPGDYLLVCTDGLSGAVSPDEMYEILMTNVSLEQKCEDLAALAKQNGTTDDITVVLAQMDPTSETSPEMDEVDQLVANDNATAPSSSVPDESLTEPAPNNESLEPDHE